MENVTDTKRRWRIDTGNQSSLTKNSTKLKRTKKSKLDPNSSIKCLQNSLKISAAGNPCQVRKPRSKRPKNKPGMPKEFVFVDLSPVKSVVDDSSDEGDKSTLVSPTITPDTIAFDKQDLNTAPYFDLSPSNDSFHSLQSDDESIFSSFDNSSIFSNSSTFGIDSYIQDCGQFDTQSSGNNGNNNAMLGLGIVNMDATSNAGNLLSQTGNIYYQGDFDHEPIMTFHPSINPLPVMEQSEIFPQFQSLKRSSTVPQLPTQNLQASSHRRTKSASEPSKKKYGSTFQFKAYKTPHFKEKKSEKPQLNDSSTIPEPFATVPRTATGLEDFMDFSNKMSVALNGDQSCSDETNSLIPEYSIVTPNTDYSENEEYASDLLKAPSMGEYLPRGCGSNDFFGENQLDFDFNAFVSY